MKERRADLACRIKCPFTRAYTHLGLRPCVEEVRSGRQFCLKKIDEHFSARGSESIELNILEKRIEIYESGKQIAVVANGVAAFLRNQS